VETLNEKPVIEKPVLEENKEESDHATPGSQGSKGV
jgi:hypothetical protein